jgi:hypothetical protein
MKGFIEQSMIAVCHRRYCSVASPLIFIAFIQKFYGNLDEFWISRVRSVYKIIIGHVYLWGAYLLVESARAAVGHLCLLFVILHCCGMNPEFAPSR